VLHAYDRAGIQLRVVVDAQFGDVLFMAPALNIADASLRAGGTHYPSRAARKRQRAEKVATNQNESAPDSPGRCRFVDRGSRQAALVSMT
jgi:hypothetical protein